MQLICILSDKDYQQKVWISGETSGSDFDEICCLFFDDIGDPLLEHYKDFGITESQYQSLKKFRDKFEAFADDHNWPLAFIDTPEWNKITEMAKEVLQAFDYERMEQDKQDRKRQDTQDK